MRAYLALAATMMVMHVVAVIALALFVLSFGKARPFCRDVLMLHTSRLCLWLGGLRLSVSGPRPSPHEQIVYVFNHTSSLDLFIACALDLRSRFFMKRSFALLPAFGIFGVVVGVFFTPPQSDQAARVRCFSGAADALKHSKESVFLSPEGTRVTTGAVGPFNRGAFHLAISLQAPIVPLRIRIDAGADPGRGYVARAGEIAVTFGERFDTTGLGVDDVDDLRARVRAHYHA